MLLTCTYNVIHKLCPTYINLTSYSLSISSFIILTNCPVFSTYFIQNSDLRSQNTRSKEELHLGLFSTSLGQRSIKYKRSHLWYSLLDKLKSVTSTRVFKQKLKEHRIRCSAVAKRPRDVSCLSVVSFNIPTAQFFYYQLLRLQIYQRIKFY